MNILKIQFRKEAVRTFLIQLIPTLAILSLPATLHAQLFFSTDNGVATIVSYNYNATTNGFPVVAIAQYAFSSATLTSITIPDTITNIPNGAFEGCTSLTSLTVAGQNPVFSSTNGVLYDKSQATLLECPAALAGSYAIPGTVTRIGTNAFYGCGLTGVTIPSGVLNIEEDAFASCDALARVTIPNSVTNIEDGAFSDCNLQAGFTFGTGLTSIGVGVFYGAGLPSITVPNRITNIGDEAFFECASLTNVTLGSGVTSIGYDAFSDCYSLAAIMIPTNVVSIELQAFYNCSDLRTITVAAQNPSYRSVNGVLFNQNQTTLVDYPTGLTGSYTVADPVTSIEEWAFGSASLTNVIIGNSVTIIGTNAFSSAGLTSVTIGNSVAEIQEGAFEYCTSLANMTIPDSVAEIGDDAFAYCNGLTDLTIPGTVLDIQNGAFAYCNGLTNVTMSDGLTTIGTSMFGQCGNLATVIIPGSVTNIGNSAFFDCASLRSVYFSGNAPATNSTVYLGDSEVTSYYLPGTSGWTTNFDGFPTALWTLPDPLVLSSGPGFGIQSNRFGFTVSWATNLTVVVEACTNLSHPVWTPLQTNSLTNGAFSFSDPQWTNHPERFYRISSP